VANRSGRAAPEAEPTQAAPEAEPTVTLTVTLPRNYSVMLLKESGASVVRDLAALTPDAFRHLVAYGIGRFNRDGATPDEWTECGADEDGAAPATTQTIEDGAGGATLRVLTYRRKATLADRAAEAVKLSDDKWTRLLAGTLRSHVGGTADPVLAETRTIVVRALVKRGVARKAIPRLPDHAAIVAACAAFPGLAEKAQALAKKVVAARGSEDL